MAAERFAHVPSLTNSASSICELRLEERSFVKFDGNQKFCFDQESPSPVNSAHLFPVLGLPHILIRLFRAGIPRRSVTLADRSPDQSALFRCYTGPNQFWRRIACDNDHGAQFTALSGVVGRAGDCTRCNAQLSAAIGRRSIDMSIHSFQAIR